MSSIKLLSILFLTHSNDKYNVEQLGYHAYLQSHRFNVHAVAVCEPDGKCSFHSDARSAIDDLCLIYGADFSEVTAGMYDAVLGCSIMKKEFGFIPPEVIDLKPLSHLIDGPLVSDDLKDIAERNGIIYGGSTTGCGELQLSRMQLCHIRQKSIMEVKTLHSLLLSYVRTADSKELRIQEHTRNMFLYPRLKLCPDLLNTAQTELSCYLPSAIAPYTLTELRSQSPISGTHEYSVRHNVPDFQRKRTIAYSGCALQTQIAKLQATAGLARGMLPIYLEYSKAISGRFAGGNRLNMQNLPNSTRCPSDELKRCVRLLKRSIVAEDGHKLVSADAAQIELRVLAWFTGETELIKALGEGRDVYAEFASEVFLEDAGKPLDDSPHEQRKGLLRKIGKAAVLGLGYRMGEATFMKTIERQLGNTLSQLYPDKRQCALVCKRIVEQFRQKYGKISVFWESVGTTVSQVLDSGVPIEWNKLRILKEKNSLHIRLPSGRNLIYPDCRRVASKSISFSKITDEGEIEESFMHFRDVLIYAEDKPLHGGKLTENIIQGIARDLLVEAILKAKDAGLPVALHVHDEIIVSVPEEQAEHAKQKLIDIWRTPPAWGKDLCLDAEAIIGNNFLEIE